MKKMILAPAVALAFTGLIAAPVAAAEQPSTEQPTNTSATASTAKAAETAPAAEPKTEAAETEKPAAETPEKTMTPEKTEDPASESPKTEAPQEEAPKPSTSAPAPKKTTSETPKAKATPTPPQAAPIEATLTVDPTAITAKDLVDPAKGVTITITGVKAGDTVSDSLSSKTDTVTTDGTYVGQITYGGDASDLKEGPVDFTVTITREGESDKELNGQFEIVSDAPDFAPEANLSPKSLTQSQFTDAAPWTDESKGVTITVTGLLPGDYVHNEDPHSNQYDTVEASDNGQLEYRMYNNNGSPATVTPGVHEFNITVNRKDANGDVETKTLPLQYEIIADEDADTLNASLTVIPEEITAEDMANEEKGFEIRVSGVKAGDTVTDSLTGQAETVEKDGTFSNRLFWKGDPSDLEEGPVDFTVTVKRGEGEAAQEQVLNGTITIVAEPEAPAEASLTITPKKLEAGDFVNEKKGVTLTVKDCKPGEDVRFQVNPKGLQVTAYDRTVPADKDGSATVTVYGTSSDSSAYVGDYTVTATCGDEVLKGAFSVTSAAKGGGDDGDDDKSDGSNDDTTTTVNPGSDLPRTGADLSGLAAGALLLLIGGAAVTLTGRRKKMSSDPSTI